MMIKDEVGGLVPAVMIGCRIQVVLMQWKRVYDFEGEMFFGFYCFEGLKPSKYGQDGLFYDFFRIWVSMNPLKLLLHHQQGIKILKILSFFDSL